LNDTDFQRIESILDRLAKAIAWTKTVGGVLVSAILLFISAGYRAAQFIDRVEAIDQTNIRQDRAIEEGRLDTKRILNDLAQIKDRLGINR